MYKIKNGRQLKAVTSFGLNVVKASIEQRAALRPSSQNEQDKNWGARRPLLSKQAKAR